ARYGVAESSGYLLPQQGIPPVAGSKNRIATRRAGSWVQPNLRTLGQSPVRRRWRRRWAWIQDLRRSQAFRATKFTVAEVRNHRFDPSSQNATAVRPIAWPARGAESAKSALGGSLHAHTQRSTATEEAPERA